MEKEVEKYFEPNEEEEIKLRQDLNKNLINIVNTYIRHSIICMIVFNFV